MKGFDQTTNLILSGSIERVYSLDEGVEEVPLGLYIVRGDNIASRSLPTLAPRLTPCPQTLIGEVDPELEKTIGKSFTSSRTFFDSGCTTDLSTIRADPIAEVVH